MPAIPWSYSTAWAVGGRRAGVLGGRAARGGAQAAEPGQRQPVYSTKTEHAAVMARTGWLQRYGKLVIWSAKQCRRAYLMRVGDNPRGSVPGSVFIVTELGRR